MSDCWKCDEQLPGYGNYCGQCGAPQNAKMAVQSLNYSAKDFKTGVDGILDLLDGCPEMLAEGLADDDRFGDISVDEWERRFEDSFEWLELFFFRIWLSHYNLSEHDIKRYFDEKGVEFDVDENRDEELPIPSNGTCACGASLPANPPSVVTRWKDSMESQAVCFDCFGDISTRIAG